LAKVWTTVCNFSNPASLVLFIFFNCRHAQFHKMIFIALNSLAVILSQDNIQQRADYQLKITLARRFTAGFDMTGNAREHAAQVD
jgi:hypothetical protein